MTALGTHRGLRELVSVLELRDAPPRFVEYGFYFWLFYNIFSEIIGISISMLGFGIVAMLAVYCVARLGPRAVTVYKPLRLPLAFGASFLAIQVIVHDQPLMGGDLRAFVPWILTLVLVYSLSLRKGFQHRFAWAALAVGVCLLPYLDIRGEGSVERVGLEAGVGLGNPNDLAAWFGFLALYFAILGLNTQRHFVRIVSYAIAIGTLFVVALTVSRSPILAVGIALVIASRNLLKRGFIPLLILSFSIWGVYESRVFDKYIAEYVERGTEETGRLVVWPLVINRIIDSPLIGVGLPKIETDVPGRVKPVTPHNNFLSIALASGIVPLFFFIGYWWSAAQGSFSSSISGDQRAGSPFQLPLIVYAFLQAQVLDLSFMLPWLIVTLSEGLRTGAREEVLHSLVRRAGGAKRRKIRLSTTPGRP